MGNGLFWLHTLMNNKLVLLLLAVLAVSCGTDSKHFKLSGRLLNINQGEFYVYSDDGEMKKVDTIKVQGGRFAYEMVCTSPQTLTMVFPNFSQQPIFAEPGEEVDITGDASHLKELKVKGTKDNELMNDFREEIAQASPPEITQKAVRFAEDHPQSAVALWLVRRYLLSDTQLRLKEARRLLHLIKQSQQHSPAIGRLEKAITAMEQCTVGSRWNTAGLHADMGGKLPTATQGNTVVLAWATWNYNSTDLLREIQQLQRQHPGRFQVVTINLDANKNDYRQVLTRDSITFPTIADGLLFEGNAAKRWNIQTVPTILLVQNGTVKARDIDMPHLKKLLNINS